MALSAGTRLGPYDILGLIGAGGMGEVYRAHDRKLNRDVALKVLPAALANDPERLSRFSREAQVLASLNHPHIAQIYGLEDADNVRALVLELVVGPTLADRIGQGAIPPEEALLLARQIAEALEAAHEQGVVHRDLKPANIKVRPDGTVKVLDFGLAKALAPPAAISAAAALANSPTTTGPTMTEVGAVVGTPTYMSPEQIRGLPLDRRTDLWAFGCVLYEMLTGRRPFGGDTASDVSVAILSGEPDWMALPTATPPPIRRLLRRCLQRDRRRRLADAADARLEIDDGLNTPDGEVVTVDRRGFHSSTLAIAALPIIALVAAIAVWALMGTPSPAPRLPVQFTIVPPPGLRQERRFT